VAVSFIIAVIHKDLTRSSSHVGAHFLLLIRYFQSAQWPYLLLKFSISKVIVFIAIGRGGDARGVAVFAQGEQRRFPVVWVVSDDKNNDICYGLWAHLTVEPPMSMPALAKDRNPYYVWVNGSARPVA
jgi:hypothetical protein